MSKNAQHIQTEKIITTLLAALPSRQRDVLSRRFGLKDGKRRTLEEIGEGYHITRERVRQIENDAKAAVLKSHLIKALDPFFDALVEHFDRHGGMRAEHVLFDRDAPLFFPGTAEKIARAYLHLLVTIHEAFEKHPETDEFHTLWAVKHAKPDQVKKSLTELVKKLDETKELVGKEKLFMLLREYMDGELSTEALESYLAASKAIGANVFGEYGLRHWPEINIRGVRDKAYLVLKRHTKPMHFREIVARINETFMPKKATHPQTVHNELIKSGKFVLVGRGMYALSDWGYEPGKVLDVMRRIMARAGHSMTKDDIVDAVLKERNVKLNTIVLNLQNKAYFEKMKDGKFLVKS
ncbi:MAG: sigma factor-like helix-turn-helix DNA-binding protein [Patescibacteria group bacterium]